MVKLFIPVKPVMAVSHDGSVNLEEIFVERRFGRCPYYMLYDTTTEKAIYVKNTNHHFGGSDSPQSIAKNNGADAVFAAHMGYGPFMMFDRVNIPIYQVEEHIPAGQLISLYQSGDLKLMTAPPKGSCCSGNKK